MVEEELIEIVILFSFESEGLMILSDERNIYIILSGRVNEIGLEVICSFNVCLIKSFSFENGIGSRLMFKWNRIWSVLVLGFGVMLLKVVGVLDFGKMVLRKVFVVGYEMMFGVDVIWVR